MTQQQTIIHSYDGQGTRERKKNPVAVKSPSDRQLIHSQLIFRALNLNSHIRLFSYLFDISTVRQNFRLHTQ